MSTPTIDKPTRAVAGRAALVLLATLLAHALVLDRVSRVLAGAESAPEAVAVINARLLPPPPPVAPPPAAPAPAKPPPAPVVRPKPPETAPVVAAAAPVPVEVPPAVAEEPSPDPNADPQAGEARAEPESAAAVEQPTETVAEDAPEFEASGDVLRFALTNLPEARAAMPAAARFIYRTTNSELRIATGTTVVDWSLSADGRYELRLATRAVGVTVLELVSRGRLSDFGLAPERYTEARVRRAAEAANFDWDGRRITFSSRTYERALADGTQDRVSFQIQLMLLGQAQPQLFRTGARLVMWMAGRDDLAVYRFRSAGPDRTATGIGVLDAVKIERTVSLDGEARIDVWLVPHLGWLPVRLRFTDRLGRVTESVLESIPNS